MTKIVYVGPSPAVDIVGGYHAVNGEAVDVPDDLAASLCAGDTFELASKKADPAATDTTPQEGN